MSRKKRAVCFFAALLFLLPSFFSCSSRREVLHFRSKQIGDRVFSYALSLKKTQILAGLAGSTSSLTDDPEIWATQSPTGKTYGELVWEGTLRDLSLILFYCDYAGEKELSLSTEEKSAAQEKVENIVSSFASEQAFQSYMKTYGIDRALLEEYYTLDALAAVGMKAYYSAPATSLTEADCKQYYRENYVTGLFLYLNLTNQTLENGKTVPLTEAQRAEKLLILEQARASLAQGTGLAAFLAQSDDSSFPDGVARTFEKGALAEDSLFEAFGALADGTHGEKETSTGIYLLQKEPLSTEYYNDSLESELLPALVTLREDALLASIQGEIVQNEEALSAFSVTNALIFS